MMHRPRDPEDSGETRSEKDALVDRFDALCGSLSGADSEDSDVHRLALRDHHLENPVSLGGRTYSALRAIVDRQSSSGDAHLLILAAGIDQLEISDDATQPVFTSEPGTELTVTMGDLHFINPFEERAEWEQRITLECYNDLVGQLEERQTEGSIL